MKGRKKQIYFADKRKFGITQRNHTTSLYGNFHSDWKQTSQKKGQNLIQASKSSMHFIPPSYIKFTTSK